MTVATSTVLSKPDHRYRTSSVMQAEWIKMRSVRSTKWTIVAMATIVIGIAIIAGATVSNQWHNFSLLDRLTFDPTSISLRGLLFGQLVIGVLGVMVMSAEYGTGTIRATFAAVPNRPLVLAAKAAVFTVIATVVGQVLSFGAFFVGQTLLTSPAPHATLSQPGVLRAVVGGGLMIPVLGLLALGIATIVRHTAGAITTFVGVLLVLPIVVQALPSSINQAISKFLPFQIGDVMTTVAPSVGHSTAFGPWVGFALVCAYAVVALAVGGWMMARRDA